MVWSGHGFGIGIRGVGGGEGGGGREKEVDRNIIHLNKIIIINIQVIQIRGVLCS